MKQQGLTKTQQHLADTSSVTIHKLICPVPPMLEQAIGYTDDAHLIAIWFGMGGEAYYSDGQITTVGEWDAANLFFNHPLLEEPPAYYLLLDRESRLLSVAPVAEAERLLCEQWGTEHAGPEQVLVVTEEEWDLFVRDLVSRLPQVSPAQFVERWREHQRHIEALTVWLAEQWEEA
jgi:hypothetical protein